MTNKSFDDGLAAHFALEDAAFTGDGEQFVGAVNTQINRRLAKRRLLLAGATLIGGLVASSKIPALLTSLGEYPGPDLAVLTDPSGLLQNAPMGVMAALLVGALSLLVVFSAERI